MKKMVNKLEAKIMKKNYLLLIAASVALAFTACSTKELDLPEEKESGVAEEMKHVSLSATTENDNSTKVTLDGTTYGWSSGVDKLMVTTTDGLVESSTFSSDGHFTLDYSGSRDGYAVIPSTFLTGYDGSNLTITYPSSYDISSYITDSYLAGGKYDAAGAYLPIPMIATSTEGDDNLKFYALGALVRVTISDVPVGTKKLFITFNQTVTGNFTVTSPIPGTNSVAVVDASTPSTVEFTISADGITPEQAVNNFVLYIPVPTTSGLGIASSSKTKATVERNNGYAWAVHAITYTGNKGYFQTTDGIYEFAPGNLLAYKTTSGKADITYSFEDPLISTRGAMNDDPHLRSSEARYTKGDVIARSISPLLSELGSDGNGYQYQDVFSWDVLRAIVGDLPDDTEKGAGYYLADNEKYTWNSSYYDTHDYYNFAANAIEIDGKTWSVPTEKFWATMVYLYENVGYDVNRTGVLATVSGRTNAQFSKMKVLVTGNDTYDGYGYTFSDEKLYVPGTLFFPDGYVDQTDLLGAPNRRGFSSDDATPSISIDQFNEMIANGAVFLNSSGMHVEADADPANWAWSWVPLRYSGDKDYATGEEYRYCGYYISSTITFSLNKTTHEYQPHTSGNFGLSGFNCLYNGGSASSTRPLERSYLVRLVREVVTPGASSGAEERDGWDTAE